MNVIIFQVEVLFPAGRMDLTTQWARLMCSVCYNISSFRLSLQDLRANGAVSSCKLPKGMPSPQFWFVYDRDEADRWLWEAAMLPWTNRNWDFTFRQEGISGSAIVFSCPAIGYRSAAVILHNSLPTAVPHGSVPTPHVSCRLRQKVFF